MQVFLVPRGGIRHGLYSESTELDYASRDGIVGRLFRRLSQMSEFDRARRRDGRSDGWMSRVRVGLVRVMAEWVVEQRLLWHLRHRDTAVLVYPVDLDADQAMSIVSVTLQGDANYHRFWMVIDGLAVLVFGPLFFFIPGPNLISWYFAVKTTGHWLSFQGARHGSTDVAWSLSPSVPLAAVCQALTLPPDERSQCLRAISRELGLEGLVTFVERTETDKS